MVDDVEKMEKQENQILNHATFGLLSLLRKSIT